MHWTVDCLCPEVAGTLDQCSHRVSGGGGGGKDRCAVWEETDMAIPTFVSGPMLCNIILAPTIIMPIVSYPDSHVHPPEKRVWPLSKGFLVFLSEH